MFNLLGCCGGKRLVSVGGPYALRPKTIASAPTILAYASTYAIVTL
jgi:hypothetical protein